MAEERTPSDLDAMGQDKRRSVVGGRYGASPRKRLAVYGVVLAATAVLVIVFLTVVQGIDNRDIELEPTAPWSEAVSLEEPRPIDFPANGPTNTIEVEQIGEAVPPSEVTTEPG